MNEIEKKELTIVIKMRASFVGKIMAEPTLKADKEAGNLSKGAKTALNCLAKQLFYGYQPQLKTKAIVKGNQCEQDSIDLFNRVFGTTFEKNKIRANNDFMTGECDILGDDVIIDIKSSYSLDTFPPTSEECENSDYYWQGVMYMHLYNKPRYQVAYCLVDTPDELCRYEQEALHNVSHINPRFRVTVWDFERNLGDEARMIEKCKKACEYVASQISKIQKEHDFPVVKSGLDDEIPY